MSPAVTDTPPLCFYRIWKGENPLTPLTTLKTKKNLPCRGGIVRRGVQIFSQRKGLFSIGQVWYTLWRRKTEGRGLMGLTTTEKIRTMAKRKGLTLASVAEKLGYSRQNVNYKLRMENWTEADIRKYADAVGCDVEIIFVDRTTGERL